MEMNVGDKFKDLEATVIASDGWQGVEPVRRQVLTIDVEGKRFPFTNFQSTGKELSIGDEIKLSRAEMGLYKGILQVYLPRGAPLEITGKADVEQIEKDNTDRAEKELNDSLEIASRMLPKFVNHTKLSDWERGDLMTRWAISMNMSKRH